MRTRDAETHREDEGVMLTTRETVPDTHGESETERARQRQTERARQSERDRARETEVDVCVLCVLCVYASYLPVFQCPSMYVVCMVYGVFVRLLHMRKMRSICEETLKRKVCVSYPYLHGSCLQRTSIHAIKKK